MSFIRSLDTIAGLPLSVRGAGHEIWTSVVENGVVIDLSQMKTVTVDPDSTHSSRSSWSNGWT